MATCVRIASVGTDCSSAATPGAADATGGGLGAGAGCGRIAAALCACRNSFIAFASYGLKAIGAGAAAVMPDITGTSPGFALAAMIIPETPFRIGAITPGSCTAICSQGLASGDAAT